MFRIRRSLEPDLKEIITENKILLYSILTAYPKAPKMDEIKEMIEHYFLGVKCILFVGDAVSYENILGVLNSGLEKHNIDHKGNNLYVGYNNRVLDGHGSECFRIFNFELYLVKKLHAICFEILNIREGNISSEDHVLLEKLSQCTMFSLQQYEVEHAITEKDIYLYLPNLVCHIASTATRHIVFQVL